MSAGICGKRLGFEEVFGSPSSAPSAKRSRCASYDSPVRQVEWGLGHEDKVSILVGLFPSIDREVIETVLRNHDHKIDDAIKSLHLSLGGGFVGTEAVCLNSMLQGSQNPLEGGINSEASELKYEGVENDILEPQQHTMPKDVSSWSAMLVEEMKNASGWDDVRCRAMKILDAFEKGVVAQTSTSFEQPENSSLKEQLQCQLKENQILKRAVAIQHERSLEQEVKLKEVHQLKHLISQYQGQIRVLELNNYTLKIHLQKAQDASCIPGQFHPDIF